MRKIIVLIFAGLMFFVPARAEIDDFNQEIIDTNFDTEKVISGSVAHNVDMTLDNCIRIALGNNPEITSAFEDILINDVKIKQIWSNFFPVVSWQTSWSHIKQLQLSDALSRNLEYEYYVLGQISLQQMLYDFGVTQNQVTIRKLEYKQYNLILTETINDVLCNVKNAYYNVLYTVEQYKVAQEMVERYKLFYDQAKAFYTAGTKPKVDLTIAQVNLSNAKLNLIEAENAVDIAMAKLNNTMGLPYLYKYKIQDVLKYNPCKISLNDAIETAKKSRPDLQLADVKIETARQNVKLTKKSWFPQLTIEGQFMVGGRTFTSNTVITMGLF